MKETKEIDKIMLYPPTASRFKDILSPTGKVSRSSDLYIDDIIRWSFYGADEIKFASFWTERGKELEEKAIGKYCSDNNLDMPSGKQKFIYNKEYRCGCYPDGMIGGGCQEIKCLKDVNHKAIVGSGIIPLKFKPQIQGTLLITGLPWLDFIAYHPGEDFFVKRVTIDQEWCDKFIEALSIFNFKLQNKFNEYMEVLRNAKTLNNQTNQIQG